MSFLHEHEEYLCALLAAEFPGHTVFADAGDLATILRERTLAGPTLIVRLAEWLPAPGALVWSILALEDDRRAPVTRRVGLVSAAAPSGLLATIAKLREVLGGDDAPGFRALGGKGVRVDSPLLAWEERVEELPPEAFAPLAVIPAAFVTELIDEGPLASGVEIGDTHFDELDELPSTARILVCDADGTNATDLGGIFESEPGVFSLVVPAPRAIASGSRLIHAISTTRIPVGARVTESESFAAWRPLSARLDGRFAAGRVGPRARTLEFSFPTLTPGERAALDAFLAMAEGVLQPIYLPGDGTTRAIALIESRRPLHPANAAPTVLIATAIAIENILPFVESL